MNRNYPRTLLLLNIITLGALLVATWMVFFYAPVEAVMGMVQKVFYFHVASTWTGMLGFLVAAISGGTYLATKDTKWDRVALAGVEIGIFFTLIGIITGSIWARPVWNTWWTWDPRLTTTTIMVLIYAAYLLLRQGIDEQEKRARFAAVYAIVGFITVPMTFLPIRYYRTIHPVLIDPNEGFGLGPGMMTAFFLSLASFTVLYIVLLMHRYRLERMKEEVDDLKERLGY